MSGQQIIKPEDIRIFFDSKEEPAAYADAGENVVFYCMDCYGKKPRFLPTPFLVTEHTYCTTAAAVSLDECSLAVARKMHRWLTEEFELTDAQAAMLLSLQGNLRISQIVNPLKGCVMELPLRLLHQLKRKSY